MKRFKQTILTLGSISLIFLGGISLYGITFPFNLYGIMPILLGVFAISMTRDIT